LFGLFISFFLSCVTPQQISIKEKAHKEETTIAPQQYNRLFFPLSIIIILIMTKFPAANVIA
jgi:hypothetical protein